MTFEQVEKALRHRVKSTSHLAGAARDAGKKAAYQDIYQQTQTANPYAGRMEEEDWQQSYDKARKQILGKGGFFPGDKVTWRVGRKIIYGTVAPGGSGGYVKVRVDRNEGPEGGVSGPRVGSTPEVSASGLERQKALHVKGYTVSGDTLRYVPDSDRIKQWIQALPARQRDLALGTHETFQRDGKWFAKFSDGHVSPFGKRTQEEAFKAIKDMIYGIVGNIV